MISLDDIKKSTQKTFSRSSGPGGQNVNKVSTKVQLSFDISGSHLSDQSKKRLLIKYPVGFIQVSNQETRFQFRNTALAFQNLLEQIRNDLKVQSRRIPIKSPHLGRAGKLRKMLKDKLLRYKRKNEQ